VPASKRRRRPAAAPRTARRAGTAVAQPSPPVASEPAPARPVRGRPSWAGPAPGDDETRWSRVGLLVLLALTFGAQLVVGAIIHVTGHRQRLLLVDLVFFQAPFVLAGSVLLMPLAKRLTHQPRMLRLLEALSLGAIFALFALLLAAFFVHPATAASQSSDQLLDQLKTSDALGIAMADLLAMLVAVQLFPGLQRVLTAPGRRARQRLLEKRAASGQASASARRSTREARPRR
jgi:hypothetical protein